jgi:hypothetical protein
MRYVAFRPEFVPSKELDESSFPMKDVMKFRRYAEDCRRLSNSMKPEHKTTLLEIAEAWGAGRGRSRARSRKRTKREKGIG